MFVFACDIEKVEGPQDVARLVQPLCLHLVISPNLVWYNYWIAKGIHDCKYFMCKVPLCY